MRPTLGYLAAIDENDIELDEDTAGELLRSLFFAGDGGCYWSFDVRPGVESLPDEPLPQDERSMPDDHWTVYRYNGVKMRYFWDGDGTLEFKLSDGTVLHNGDCKKSYGWEYIDK